MVNNTHDIGNGVIGSITTPDGTDGVNLPSHLAQMAQHTLYSIRKKPAGRTADNGGSCTPNRVIPRESWDNLGFPLVNAPTWATNSNWAYAHVNVSLHLELSGLGTANDNAWTGYIMVTLKKRTIGGGEEAWNNTGSYQFRSNGNHYINHAALWHTYNFEKDARVEIVPRVWCSSGWTPKVVSGFVWINFFEAIGTAGTLDGIRAMPLAPSDRDHLGDPMPPPNSPTYVKVAPDGQITQHLTDLAWANRIDKPSAPGTTPIMFGDGPHTFDGTNWV